MKISIGADHRGYVLKQYLLSYFSAYDWLDVGTDSTERTDYPLFASQVCKNILSRQSDLGLLICGSGIGMSIAANRHPGIYAAICWSEDIARLAREDDGSNVLVLPSDFITPDQAVTIFNVWVRAEFKGGRYEQRLKMLD